MDIIVSHTLAFSQRHFNNITRYYCNDHSNTWTSDLTTCNVTKPPKRKHPGYVLAREQLQIVSMVVIRDCKHDCLHRGGHNAILDTVINWKHVKSYTF